MTIMRFLDLDLDFFLNEIAYSWGCNHKIPRTKYQPWTITEVRQFLENRCGVLPGSQIPGRILDSHDRILDFWHILIETGKLKIPFEVVHVDAHPDMCIVDGLFLSSQFLYIDTKRALLMLEKKTVHPGNYLTFAMVYGWINSLTWINLKNPLNINSVSNGDTRIKLKQCIKKENKSPPINYPTIVKRKLLIRFKMLSWLNFRTNEPFDYIALSKSPSSTPPKSKELIPVIKEYIDQI